MGCPCFQCLITSSCLPVFLVIKTLFIISKMAENVSTQNVSLNSNKISNHFCHPQRNLFSSLTSYFPTVERLMTYRTCNTHKVETGKSVLSNTYSMSSSYTLRQSTTFHAHLLAWCFGFSCYAKFAENDTISVFRFLSNWLIYTINEPMLNCVGFIPTLCMNLTP